VGRDIPVGLQLDSRLALRLRKGFGARRQQEGLMEHLISSLVAGFERGSLSRRELIQTLGVLVTAQTPSPAEVLTVASINHVSIQVSNLERSVAFYKRVFGLTDDRSDAETARLASGRCHVSLRRGNPVGVDHFAFGINLDSTRAQWAAELKRRGAEALEDPQVGFYVSDPDGVRVQIYENDAKDR
jgi:catechol 2,3-dioxygenase-like lactoylglutathione lyase family enzyme